MSQTADGHDPLLSLRAAVVLVIGALAATGAGTLIYLAGQTPAAALLAAGSAFSATVALAHTLIA